MPKAFPPEFGRDVVAVARKGDGPISQTAKDFGISESCLHRWLSLADIEDGTRPGVTRVGVGRAAGGEEGGPQRLSAGPPATLTRLSFAARMAVRLGRAADYRAGALLAHSIGRSEARAATIGGCVVCHHAFPQSSGDPRP